MEFRKSALKGGVIVSDGDGNVIGLTESEQRELIVYLWKEKPDLIRDIICENCPEVC